jgi:hypothetical protein
MAIVCGADSLDAGQLALAAAEGTKLNYNFKVSLADQRTISGQPTYLYFSAMVMGDRRNIGNVSNIIKRTYNLGVNTAILETAPS